VGHQGFCSTAPAIVHGAMRWVL